MRAVLDDAPLLEHEDDVRVDDLRDAVRDDDRGALLFDGVKAVFDLLGRNRVEGAVLLYVGSLMNDGLARVTAAAFILVGLIGTIETPSELSASQCRKKTGRFTSSRATRAPHP